MTSQKERTALYDRLREVLGEASAATMEAMFEAREDLATKDDLARLGAELRTEMSELRTELRNELASEIGGVRTEIGFLRQELELKYATRDDLLDLRRDFDSNLRSYVRSFMAVQAGSMVGLTGIFYALVRST